MGLMAADSKVLLFCLSLMRVKREQCLQKYISTMQSSLLPVIREYRTIDPAYETIDPFSPLKRPEHFAICWMFRSFSLSLQQPKCLITV